MIQSQSQWDRAAQRSKQSAKHAASVCTCALWGGCPSAWTLCLDADTRAKGANGPQAKLHCTTKHIICTGTEEYRLSSFSSLRPFRVKYIVVHVNTVPLATPPDPLEQAHLSMHFCDIYGHDPYPLGGEGHVYSSQALIIHRNISPPSKPLYQSSTISLGRSRTGKEQGNALCIGPNLMITG